MWPGATLPDFLRWLLPGLLPSRRYCLSPEAVPFRR